MPSEELVRVRLQPSGAPCHSEVRVLGSIDEWQAYSQVRTTEDAVGFVEQELGERLVSLRRHWSLRSRDRLAGTAVRTGQDRRQYFPGGMPGLGSTASPSREPRCPSPPPQSELEDSHAGASHHTAASPTRRRPSGARRLGGQETVIDTQPRGPSVRPQGSRRRWRPAR